MQIEDGFTFSAGIAVGAIVMQHVALMFRKEVKRDIRAKKVSLIKIDGGLRAYADTMHELYETFWAYITYKLFNGSPISIRNKTLSKLFFILFWVLCVVCIYIGIRFLLIVSPNA
jgi:hypothetical protein